MCFKHYDSEDHIAYILSTNTIYLSNGINWNDLVDRANFNPIESLKIRFAFCFSFSKSENVAMWMLYGKNDGCMIDFNKEVIKEIISSNTISLGYFEAGRYNEVKKLENRDFDISIMDIVYYGEPKNRDSNTYYVKRSDEVVQNYSSSIVDAF